MHGLAASKTGTDWFEQSCEMNRKLDERRRAGTKFSISAAIRSGSTDVAVLRSILAHVRNITRNHGVPRNCLVDFGTLQDSAAGCAGFKDAPNSFEEPFILLDKSPMDACEEGELLDVYCGIGVHEASHILHTRERLKRLAAGMSKRRRLYDDLWEDERVEMLARERSPGYAPLLQATKHALIERPMEKLDEHWDELPDMDKIEKLLFAFIRCPHCLGDAMRNWTAINGECVFETLRECFLSAPKSETDVGEFAGRTEELWRRIRKLYPDLPDQFIEERRAGILNDAVVDQVLRQLEADASDRALLVVEDEDAESVVERLLKEAERFERAARRARIADRMKLESIAERLLDLACDVQKSGNPRTGRDGKRFGYPEVKKLIETRDSVSRPLAADEATELADLQREEDNEDGETDTRFQFGDDWDWDGTRQTVIQYSSASTESHRLFDEDRHAVRGHSAALRRLLRRRQSVRVQHRRLLKHGKVDPRQVSRGFFDDRVFRVPVSEPQNGLAICLLVDESGSMQFGTASKFDAARKVVALFADAFQSAPDVELEIYSHSSCGDDHRDCLLRYCFGRRNQDVSSIAEFVGGNNYDHQAILTAGDLFRRNTVHPHRWMFVISDGAPSGEGYEGSPAIEATRFAVQQLRRSGIHVLNIAVEDYASEEIFGESWVVKYTVLHELVAQVRRLLTRLLRPVI